MNPTQGKPAAGGRPLPPPGPAGFKTAVAPTSVGIVKSPSFPPPNGVSLVENTNQPAMVSPNGSKPQPPIPRPRVQSPDSGSTNGDSTAPPRTSPFEVKLKPSANSMFKPAPSSTTPSPAGAPQSTGSPKPMAINRFGGPLGAGAPQAQPQQPQLQQQQTQIQQQQPSDSQPKPPPRTFMKKVPAQPIQGATTPGAAAPVPTTQPQQQQSQPQPQQQPQSQSQPQPQQQPQSQPQQQTQPMSKPAPRPFAAKPTTNPLVKPSAVKPAPTTSPILKPVASSSNTSPPFRPAVVPSTTSPTLTGQPSRPPPSVPPPTRTQQDTFAPLSPDSISQLDDGSVEDESISNELNSIINDAAKISSPATVAPASINNSNSNSNSNLAQGREESLSPPPTSTAGSSAANTTAFKKVTKKEWRPVTPSKLVGPVEPAVASQSSDLSRQITQRLEKSQKAELERVRVLTTNNRIGDGLNLSYQRGDIIEVVDKGEKNMYNGHNGLMTGAFNIGNTKTMSPLSIQPPAGTEYAVCIRDYRATRDLSSSSKALILMRGDVLAILEKHGSGDSTTCRGRMRNGLDGWSDIGEFPSSCVRVVTQREYQLHSDVQDVTTEISERSEEPFDTLDVPAKETEKVQQALRELTRSLRATQDRLISEGASADHVVYSELRREIETVSAKLSNEYYVCDESGEILTDDNVSPLVLLRKHYASATSDKKKKQTTTQATSLTANAAEQSSATLLASQKKWEYGQLVVDIKIQRMLPIIGKKTVELYFSLYNFVQGRPISEQLVVSINEGVIATPISKILFKDVEPSDITEDIVLLCRVVRRGTMKDVSETQQIKKGSATDLRRGYAQGSISLLALFNDKNVGVFEREQSVLFWMSSSDVQFPALGADISKGCSPEELHKQGIEPAPPKGVGANAQLQMQVSMAFYDQSFKRAVELWPELATMPRVEKFEHRIVINERKHQLYITLDSGKLSQGKKIEIAVRARLNTGELIQNCLSNGTAGTFVSEFRSVVCSSTSPIWSETIHVDIPAEKFTNAHLLFIVRNASSKANKSSPIAFGFVRLSDANKIALANGDHNLILYKASTDMIPVTYIHEDLPWTTTGDPKAAHHDKSSKFSLKKNESLKIKSLFHTTQFVQHAAIAQLIDWKSHEDHIPAILEKFSFVDPISIMRNLTPVIDALFKIYDSNTAGSLFIVEPVALMVYNTIVFIIGLLTDDRTNRFKYFKQVLDSYIQTQFSGALAHKHILNCLSYHMQDISSKESAKISSTLKALDYMFQLIVKSRLVYLQQQGAQQANDEQWRADILEFLGMLNKLMSNSAPQLIVVQTLALINFATMMKGLSNFFNKKQLCEILCQFIESVYFGERSDHLNTHKLSIFHQILSGPLPLDRETIPNLLPTLVATIDKHVASPKPEEAKLATQLLALTLESLEQLDQADKQKCITSILKMLPKLLLIGETITNDFVASAVCAALESRKSITQSAREMPTLPTMSVDHTYMITCLLTLFDYMLKFNIANLHLVDKSAEVTRTTLRRTLKILDGLMSRQAYPTHWLAMMLFHLRVSHRLQQDVLTPLIYRYAPLQPQMSDTELWNTFLVLQFNTLRSPLVRSSDHRIHRLHFIMSSIVDMRRSVIQSVRHNWATMASFQIHFVHFMVPLIFQLLLNLSYEVDELAQDLFTSIMQLDYEDKKSVHRVETKTIEVIDRLVIRDASCDEQIFRTFLGVRLESYFSNGDVSLSAEFRHSAKSFISNMLHLLGLMFDFRTLPLDRSFEEERTIATLKMMEYFKDRKDTYIKYLHELLNQHINSGYFTEAGHAFMLHSDLYQWGETTLPSFTFNTPDQPNAIVFPEETTTERKVRLIRLAVTYLDKGQAWEICVTLIQDLKKQYEAAHNLVALSDVLFQEADFYDKILNTERFFSEYFRVGYYGKKFPPTIQSKEYLYKGFELERLSEFTARIMAKFPNAELLKTTEPTADVMNSDGQYLLVTIVNPSSREELEKKPMREFIQGTPANSRNYLKRNNVNVFLYSKPFKKTTAKSGNEFADLWVRNHFLFTDATFPTIHRRAEVIRKEHIELAPVEVALNSVNQKCEDLEEMVTKYENNSQLNLNPLAMALNGVIDAAVNGGINMYKEAFLSSNIQASVDRVCAGKLACALKRQVDILSRGLQIHSIRCPEELRGLHEKLESFFPKLKADVMSL
ncbi:hypothetical protein SAMD00019534_042540 [Acytostelium subglobosum LB1]|uniref:hypothetical protein n=1 Tax=Acytostelium subglobosum LB1 TaxID=1410327 RepID=UPI0006448261|nr:hypothetical protein SAMD00019534_042540 [Acytostelium subglobosum LB1]GAM21079.1 hypothetical protein SAMD00019534_042540 [Acytostelium subglobosum LB1]|eukprot:XP_012756213.1 hypothetical protein SAMD00019534_042540 [Acytostelium subglobosum LB1]